MPKRKREGKEKGKKERAVASPPDSDQETASPSDKRPWAPFSITAVDPALRAHDIATLGPKLYAPLDHDEACDLAIASDEELDEYSPEDLALETEDVFGRIDTVATATATANSDANANANANTPAVAHHRGRKPKLIFTAEETRFLIVLRVHRGFAFNAIARAANHEFARGADRKTCDEKQVSRKVGMAKTEGDFALYWNLIEEWSRKKKVPAGLSEEMLEEARGWLARWR